MVKPHRQPRSLIGGTGRSLRFAGGIAKKYKVLGDDSWNYVNLIFLKGARGEEDSKKETELVSLTLNLFKILLQYRLGKYDTAGNTVNFITNLTKNIEWNLSLLHYENPTLAKRITAVLEKETITVREVEHFFDGLDLKAASKMQSGETYKNHSRLGNPLKGDSTGTRFAAIGRPFEIMLAKAAKSGRNASARERFLDASFRQQKAYILRLKQAEENLERLWRGDILSPDEISRRCDYSRWAAHILYRSLGELQIPFSQIEKKISGKNKMAETINRYNDFLWKLETQVNDRWEQIRDDQKPDWIISLSKESERYIVKAQLELLNCLPSKALRQWRRDQGKARFLEKWKSLDIEGKKQVYAVINDYLVRENKNKNLEQQRQSRGVEETVQVISLICDFIHKEESLVKMQQMNQILKILEKAAGVVSLQTGLQMPPVVFFHSWLSLDIETQKKIVRTALKIQRTKVENDDFLQSVLKTTDLELKIVLKANMEGSLKGLLQQIPQTVFIKLQQQVCKAQLIEGWSDYSAEFRRQLIELLDHTVAEIRKSREETIPGQFEEKILTEWTLNLTKLKPGERKESDIHILNELPEFVYQRLSESLEKFTLLKNWNEYEDTNQISLINSIKQFCAQSLKEWVTYSSLSDWELPEHIWDKTQYKRTKDLIIKDWNTYNETERLEILENIEHLWQQSRMELESVNREMETISSLKQTINLETKNEAQQIQVLTYLESLTDSVYERALNNLSKNKVLRSWANYSKTQRFSLLESIESLRLQTKQELTSVIGEIRRDPDVFHSVFTLSMCHDAQQSQVLSYLERLPDFIYEKMLYGPHNNSVLEDRKNFIETNRLEKLSHIEKVKQQNQRELEWIIQKIDILNDKNQNLNLAMCKDVQHLQVLSYLERFPDFIYEKLHEFIFNNLQYGRFESMRLEEGNIHHSKFDNGKLELQRKFIKPEKIGQQIQNLQESYIAPDLCWNRKPGKMEEGKALRQHRKNIQTDMENLKTMITRQEYMVSADRDQLNQMYGELKAQKEIIQRIQAEQVNEKAGVGGDRNGYLSIMKELKEEIHLERLRYGLE